MASQRGRQDRTSKLLLKAIRSLPQREQDEVLRALLRGAIGSSFRPAEPAPGLHMGLESMPSMIGTPFEKQIGRPLPVRLPADLHDRLRKWSTEHGFAMAAIVRGLVERFLDDQEAGAAK